MRATAGADPAESTLITYSAAEGLHMNTTSADPNARGCSCWLCNCNRFAAPPITDVPPSPTHTLRVFVDVSVIEAHLDARLSISSRAYPRSDDATHLFVVNRGAQAAVVDSVAVWGMRSIWPA